MNLAVSFRELCQLQAVARGKHLHSLLQSKRPGSQGRLLNQAGQGLDFHELRSYQAGDDPRHLDWKVTARRGQAFTRTFAAEQQQPLVLFVDQTSQLQFGSLASKAVMAARLAALLGWMALHAGEKVGAWLQVDQGHHWHPPASRQEAFIHWLNRLAQTNQQLGALQPAPPGQLDQALQALQAHLPRGSLVILISDFFNWQQEALLKHLSRCYSLLVFQLTDPLDQHLSPADPASPSQTAASAFGQQGQQAWVEQAGQALTLDSELQKNWQQSFRRRQEALCRAVNPLGRYWEVPTTEAERLASWLFSAKLFSANPLK